MVGDNPAFRRTQREAERGTHGAVVKQVEQGNEESPPVLSIPSDQSVEMRAEGRVRVIVAKTSNHCAFGSIYCLLYLIRHLQPCHSLHL